MRKKMIIIIFSTIFFFSCLCYLLYNFDNKYKQSGPFAADGQLLLKNEDLNANRPLFLIDGWHFYPNELLTQDSIEKHEAERINVFVGQYPNFYMIGDHVISGTYALTIHKPSNQELYLFIPEIFTDYTLYINNKKITAKSGDIIPLGSDISTTIILQIKNSTHYYSGMVYPMALGDISTLTRIDRIKDALYVGMLLFSIILLLYGISIQRFKKNSIYQAFCMICAGFMLYIAYPLFHIFTMFHSFLYGIEDVGFYLMIAGIIQLHMVFVHYDSSKWYTNYIQPITYGMCLLVFIVPIFLLPTHPEWIHGYGSVIDVYRYAASAIMLFCAIQALRLHKQQSLYILSGAILFALGQLFQLFVVNLYEPAYTIWLNEADAFILLILFFIMVVKRNRILIMEHEQLTNHLQDVVDEQTDTVNALMKERKQFFYNLSHDLKAPISAIHNYVEFIQENNLYLDEETLSYINAIERKNKELVKRLSILQMVALVDQIHDPFEYISLHAMLQHIYQENLPESQALGVHFELCLPNQDKTMYVQMRKIDILFENLFYRALSVTANDGIIILSAEVKEGSVFIFLKDNGMGYTENELSKVFQYHIGDDTDQEDKIGLYIARMIVLEMNGTIEVSSNDIQGTVFTIMLPCKQLKV